MYGFEGVGLSEVQLSISELSVVGGGGWTKQAHFMVGPGRGPTTKSSQQLVFEPWPRILLSQVKSNSAAFQTLKVLQR